MQIIGCNLQIQNLLIGKRRMEDRNRVKLHASSECKLHETEYNEIVAEKESDIPPSMHSSSQKNFKL